MSDSKYEFDAQHTIMSEIEKLPGQKNYLGSTTMVCCPFHADGTPSCGIVTELGSSIPLGFFNCLGCGEKGPWNKLAKHAQLEEIESWKAVETDVSNIDARKRATAESCLETNHSLKDLLEQLNVGSLYPWSDRTDWRGYSGSFIKELGGMYNMDHKAELTCFFPIKIGKRYYGGVKAILEKVPGMPSYINTKGDWVNRYGIFPYNYTWQKIVEHDLDYVVLTEGPRDPLRLLSEGIPALAILGVNNITERKIEMIINMGVTTVYVMSDNDKGGKILRKNIKKAAKGKVSVKSIRLPEELDSDGNLIKMDPDDAPNSVIRELRKSLKRKHSVFKRNKKAKTPSKKISSKKPKKG